MVMKQISIQDLKARLSAAIAEAESGETLVITRHHEPVAQLTPAQPTSVHRGAQVGIRKLKPAMPGGTKGRSLTILLEDRGSR
jgi:prevent-host-death family protein